MSPYDTYQPFCNDDAVSIAKTQNTQKKPRHRHSPHQLAALNELFDLNEHPPLEQRSALAERLAMCVPIFETTLSFSHPCQPPMLTQVFIRRETKTVNAWFQNKRASSKKRVRGGAASHDSRQTNKSVSSVPSTQQHLDGQGVERPDGKNVADDLGAQSASSKHGSVPVIAASRQPATHHEHSSHDPRHRLSEEQLEGLRKFFNKNTHPTPEDRHALSASLGMSVSIFAFLSVGMSNIIILQDLRESN